MPSGHEEDDELFARAWDERDAAERGERAPRRPRDPVLAADLDLAAAVRDAARTLPGPDDAARARMRAGLMAEIGGPARPGTRTRRRPTRHGAERTGRGSRRPADGRPAARATPGVGRRLAANVITGACAVMLLAALTVLLSRGALPGETLYSVKRASENVEIGLTSGQEEKGLKHLEFAASRLDEVSDLVDRSTTTAAGAGPVAAGLDPVVGAFALENLRSFDEDVRTGSRMILPLAAGPTPVDLAGWARGQSARLDTLSPSLPEDGRTAAAGSQEMLQRLSARADALGGDQPCTTGDAADDLGPLPAQGCTDADTGTPTPGPAPAETESTTTSEATDTSTSTTGTTTSETTGTSSESTGADTGSSTEEGSGPEAPTEQPAPVQVPMPVPLLPQVELPPLLPGLPGISLG